MQFVNPYDIIDIPLLQLVRNLTIGLVLAVLWARIISASTWLVVDTQQYLPIFLLLIPAMIIIITVIKSSIALSLGLVGALSIVRFRTPVKEPEELLYIFVAITIGLGLGANQVLPTIIGFAFIVIAFLPFILGRFGMRRSHSAFVDIVVFTGEGERFRADFMESNLRKSEIPFKMKRVFEADDRTEITLEVPKMNSEVYENIRTIVSEMGHNFELAIMDNTRVIT